MSLKHTIILLFILVSFLIVFSVCVAGQSENGVALSLDMNIIKSQIILPEPLIAKVEIYKFGSAGRMDIIVNKVIKDSKGIVVYSSQKTIALETSVSFIDTMDLQKTLAPGIYTLVVSANYDSKTASKTETFEIMEEKFHVTVLTVVGAIVIITFISILIVIFRRLKKINELMRKLYKSKDFEKDIKGSFM